MSWLRCHCKGDCKKLIELTPFEAQLVNIQSLVPVLNDCTVDNKEMEWAMSCRGFCLYRVKMSFLYCECGESSCGLKITVPPEVLAQLDDSDDRLRVILEGCQFGPLNDWELRERRDDFSIYVEKNGK